MFLPGLSYGSINFTIFLMREPGMIVGPIANLMGIIYNFMFNIIYGVIQSGSLGITIVVFTIFIKLILVPLSVYQQKSMSKTQEIQPQIQKIQNKYKDRKDDESKQKMSMEMSEVYRKNNMTPLGGCLPLLVQLPILYALFYVFQQAYKYIGVLGDIYNNLTTLVLQTDFIGTLIPIAESKKIFTGMDLAIHQNMTALLYRMTAAEWGNFMEIAGDLAKPIQELLIQKNSIEYFFGMSLIENSGLSFPGIIIPILAGLTTFLQSWIMTKVTTGSTSNPVLENQQKIMNIMMPILMAYMTLRLPAALGLYWSIGNIFSIGQSYLIKKFYAQKKEKGVS